MEIFYILFSCSIGLSSHGPPKITVVFNRPCILYIAGVVFSDKNNDHNSHSQNTLIDFTGYLYKTVRTSMYVGEQAKSGTSTASPRRQAALSFTATATCV